MASSCFNTQIYMDTCDNTLFMGNIYSYFRTERIFTNINSKVKVNMNRLYLSVGSINMELDSIHMSDFMLPLVLPYLYYIYIYEG